VSTLEIVTAGHPALRQRARELSLEELRTPWIQALIDDLIETRRAAGGAGLAANQVAVPVRIAVIEVDEATRRRYPYKPPFPLSVIVNPELEALGEETVLINEGCLSVPGLRGDVRRAAAVRVRSRDRSGEPQEHLVRGLTAGTFQHEVDHLHGVLFLERADPRTFATWEMWERHGREEFLRRVASLPR
jgi:peptide deformylase